MTKKKSRTYCLDISGVISEVPFLNLGGSCLQPIVFRMINPGMNIKRRMQKSYLLVLFI